MVDATRASSRLLVEQFPCRKDNYGFVLHDPSTGVTAAVDTPDALKVEHVCERKKWKLTHILNTHHHNDHAGGNVELKRRFGCTVIAAEKDRHRIPCMDIGVSGGETFTLGSHKVHVLDVPGHTTGHIAFHFPDQSMVFVGDALFALGCGRLFEGTAAQAKESLERICALPHETQVFCAHEYTLTNAGFAMQVDPENPALVTRVEAITNARDAGMPTVPTSVQLELETNPFLRTHTGTVRKTLGLEAASDLDVFTELRKRRDRI